MRGLGTSPGIGIGKVFIYREPEFNIDTKKIVILEEEIERLDNAIFKAIMEIEDLYSIAFENIGKEEAEIFTAHKMILEDLEFINSIKVKINQENMNAESSVNQITNNIISIFENIEDEYIRARATDIEDVSKRILRILLDVEPVNLTDINERSIIITENLTVSDTARMNKDMIAGIVTESGGKTSHTSIIARTLEIPSIAGIKDITNIVSPGDNIIIDGTEGSIILNSTDEEKSIYLEKLNKINKSKLKMETMIGEKTISKDGHRVEIFGNINSTLDLDMVIKNDGEGVGLFRTEFLYMNKNRLPTEEEQFNKYKEITEKLEEKPLIIRTLDIGGDKEIPYLNLPKEMNPFLGYRGIRLCLDRLDIFKTQLRAIYRASKFGNIKIMFPMISNIQELRDVKIILREVKNELKKEDIDFNENLEIGIMVETPAVAIHSKAFAKEVDFFSIGTNDLIQYTVAVDRGNHNIENPYNQYHPAVLRLIKMTIDNGHKHGIRVGMCGEIAGNEKLIPVLLGMGLDEFSMNPESILKSRYIIRETSKKKIESMIDDILELDRAEDIEEFIEGIY